ncbi:MAG: NADH-quinone oxidoreductase subunit L [Caldilineaceae bacterium]|nr:NADH-quinone oxidoreductase subunit L [Caldilineaceae bacterium]
MISLAWLLLLLPLAGMLINLVLGRVIGRRATAVVASGTVGVAFLLALSMAPAVFGNHDHHGTTVHLWNWIDMGSLHVPMALLVDPLSLTMVLVVTGVGFLIHVYAIGYMEGDEHFNRFFLYLNLFILAMLLLVLGDSFLTLFIGWEGVGLASFLLIGFWFDRKDDLYGSFADCGKKAFIVNRIGDVGMILAMALIWSIVGSLEFNEVFHALEAGIAIPATAVCMLLLLAVAGKSAQFPLYVWLPDAMAGPTPVSALIHAATMVTAGIYLMARTHAFWELSAPASTTAAWVGVGTAFVAGTMALVQHDLKKVLAYSTVSQLGYMVLGAATGAFALAIFHLVTHAFFKALLFLSAGSVQHATHELDMRKLGGLQQKMPGTARCFLIGVLALAGIPIFSGFFSKDAILLSAFGKSPLLYAVGLITALITAVYAFRAWWLTFNGTPRDQEIHSHAHESGALMMVPLWILAGLATVGGALNLPVLLTLEHALEGVLGHHAPPPLQLEISLLAVSAVVAVAGWWLIRSTYRHAGWIDSVKATMKPLTKTAQSRWYLDALYDDGLVPALHAASRWFAQVVDQMLIDGIVNGSARLAMNLSRQARRVNNGQVPTYALSLFVGATILVVVFWLAV